jgi:glutathione reductase (NADPH)
MSSNKTFDLIVIGSGTTGNTVAHRCCKEGWEVAVIDERPFGGTCALRGCDPKKVLIGAAEVYDWAYRMKGHGIDPGNLKIDWDNLIKFKQSFTDPVPGNREKSFEDAGIKHYQSNAIIKDPETIQIGKHTLKTNNIVIAAGARPRPLSIPGVKYMKISDDFLELKKLPDQIVFVGGGYISMEFAHLAVRAGAKVTVIHRSSNILKHFDPFLTGYLTKASKEAGITFHLNTEVTAIEKKKKTFFVKVKGPDGEVEIPADLVVHGAGRVPNLDDMGLENIGIERNKRGIIVNNFMQSVTHANIYAGGDAADTGMPLTPIAGLDGQIIADNLLHGNDRIPDYRGTATTVFTIPPLAMVGLTEEQANARELSFRINKADTSVWYSTKRTNHKNSAYKLLIDDKTDLIIGAHLLGPDAHEMINLFSMAIRAEIPTFHLKKMLFAYPTAGYDIKNML